MAAKTEATLISDIAAAVLSGGRRTTAANVRTLLADILDSYANIVDGGQLYQAEVGYSSVFNPTQNTSFVTKKWVTDNFVPMGGIGSLSQTLAVGNNTGAYNIIVDTDQQVKFGSGTAGITNLSYIIDPNHVIIHSDIGLAKSYLMIKDGANSWSDQTINGFISIASGASNAIQLDTVNDYINVFTGANGLNLYAPKITILGVTSTSATGSGALVFGTSPTFTTDITTPLIIGGSAVGSNITYKSTSGTGTTTAAAHTFTGGTNGGTTIATLYNNGNFSIGNYASPNNLRLVTIGQDTAYMSFGSLVGTTSQAAIYLGQATPSATNYTITSDGSNVYLNTQSTTGFCYITTGNNTRFYFGRSGMASNFAADVSGATTTFSFITPAHSGQTASTEIPNFKITGNTKTWANGGGATTIATQRWNWFSANTAATSGGGSLTITESIGLDVEAASASGVTITNNFAARFTAGTATIKMGNLTGSTAVPAIYLAQSTPSTTNYNLISDGSNCILNSVNDTRINVNGSIHARFQLGTSTFSPSATTTGATNSFIFSAPSNTGQTASTEISGYLYNSYTRTWAAGTITTQRERYIKTVTYAFASASTITTAYGCYIEAPTAGTNATITNNYALGISGNINLATAGNGIYIKEGTNATMGSFSSVHSGSFTVDTVVNTTKVTANSRIILTIQSVTDTVSSIVPLAFVLTRTAGTSFTVRVTSDTDPNTIVVSWVIIEPS